jgi:hypothetical protein
MVMAPLVSGKVTYPLHFHSPTKRSCLRCSHLGKYCKHCSIEPATVSGVAHDATHRFTLIQTQLQTSWSRSIRCCDARPCTGLEHRCMFTVDRSAMSGGVWISTVLQRAPHSHGFPLQEAGVLKFTPPVALEFVLSDSMKSFRNSPRVAPL